MNEPTDIDTAMSSFIAEAQKEFSQEPEPEAPPQEIEAAPQGEGQQNTVTPEEAPVERGLERLVAREVELREREGKLSSTEKEMEALRARLRELEPRAVTPDLLDKIKFSPSEGLRALGLDPDEVVRAALVEKLGDKANDPETRALLERSRIRKEMDALRAQVQENERKQAAQAYYNQIASGAADYTRAHEAMSKHAPTVAGVAKSNPERVFQEIMGEITMDAQYRAASDPNGEPMSYEEAAKRVEKRWSDLRGLFAPAVAPTQTPQASTPTAKTPVEAKNPSNPTIKPPEKPLAPWLQRKLDEEQAINAAIAEWKRVESLNK